MKKFRSVLWFTLAFRQESLAKSVPAVVDEPLHYLSLCISYKALSSSSISLSFSASFCSLSINSFSFCKSYYSFFLTSSSFFFTLAMFFFKPFSLSLMLTLGKFNKSSTLGLYFGSTLRIHLIALINSSEY